MEATSEQPAIDPESSPKWRSLLAGAVACAVLIAIAYGVIVTFRDRDWAAAAQQQAKLFIYASPVLSRNLGQITTVSNTSEERADGTPPSYEIGFRVAGQKAKGLVEVKLTRHGPAEWLVSAAKLERGGKSIGLL